MGFHDGSGDIVPIDVESLGSNSCIPEPLKDMLPVEIRGQCVISTFEIEKGQWGEKAIDGIR